MLFASLGLAVGLAVFFPFFALGGMGGGDVKLMAALGTWIGWSPIVWTALYGAVAGGVMAVGVGSGPRLFAPGLLEHRRADAVLVGARHPADAGPHPRAWARPSASLRIAHLRGPDGGTMAK